MFHYLEKQVLRKTEHISLSQENNKINNIANTLTASVGVNFTVYFDHSEFWKAADGCDVSDSANKIFIRLCLYESEIDVDFHDPSSDVPGPPASAKCAEVFATSIKLVWEPPLKDGNGLISNYIVDKRETSRATWAQVCAKFKGDILEFNVEKLIEGREYQFRIRAENMWGVGEAFITNPVIAKNPFSECFSSTFTLLHLSLYLIRRLLPLTEL